MVLRRPRQRGPRSRRRRRCPRTWTPSPRCRGSPPVLGILPCRNRSAATSSWRSRRPGPAPRGPVQRGVLVGSSQRPTSPSSASLLLARSRCVVAGDARAEGLHLLHGWRRASGPSECLTARSGLPASRRGGPGSSRPTFRACRRRRCSRGVGEDRRCRAGRRGGPRRQSDLDASRYSSGRALGSLFEVFSSESHGTRFLSSGRPRAPDTARSRSRYCARSRSRYRPLADARRSAAAAAGVADHSAGTRRCSGMSPPLFGGLVAAVALGIEVCGAQPDLRLLGVDVRPEVRLLQVGPAVDFECALGRSSPSGRETLCALRIISSSWPRGACASRG